MDSVRGRVLVGVLLVVMGHAGAQTIKPVTYWVGSWAASQQTPEPRNALAPEDLRDATLRQVVHLSAGGSQLRVRVSNVFGTAPLRLTSVHVAKPVSAASSAIQVDSDRAVLFDGAADVMIPAGAEYLSDTVALPVAALSDLAISIHLDQPPTGQTSHPGSRSTTYLVHGDMVSAASLTGAKTVEHWYQISGVDVVATAGTAAIVTLGDSITDGHAATTNGNDRWPDVLSGRVQAAAATKGMGVLNVGTGGNRILLDGLGPNALARFDRDVLVQAGVRYVIVLEGVNDLGTLTRDGAVSAVEHQALVKRIEAAYAQMIARAHAHGVRVIGATILPYGGSNYGRPELGTEADRQAINAWIRDASHFDGVVDFDQVTRDPAQPDRMLPAYDSGDHLHPSPAGYKAMGEAVPLTFFTR
ncbi:SGNH/GDSL hydrolase family protein [Granulicella sp. L60]|uniref:SGNH/GDSL hydrolase family protein n=1 Tax=Granulicella sp. L60 TaxID=1641866 RepID=UPI0020B1103B|nr:SGNH/GDSL hydrolase family protein [Granulicella sp. L60]